MPNQKTIQRVMAILLLSCILLYIVSFGAALAAAMAVDNDQLSAFPQSFDGSSEQITTEPEQVNPTESAEPSTIPPTEPAELTTPLTFPEIIYVIPDNIVEAQDLLDSVQISVHLLWNELECPLYSSSARAQMELEIDRLNKIFDKLQYDINCFYLWEEKLEEYPYATKTWLYLKDMGYSDIASAGIIGNLMAECGGHTLALDPYLYDKATGKYYGMFQWSLKYYPKVEGMSFDEQLEYFKETVQPIFKTWGKNYKKGFTHDDFNTLTSTRTAALAFAKIYERCNSRSYKIRQNFSEVAYDYFVLDFVEN